MALRIDSLRSILGAKVPRRILNRAMGQQHVSTQAMTSKTDRMHQCSLYHAYEENARCRRMKRAAETGGEQASDSGDPRFIRLHVRAAMILGPDLTSFTPSSIS